MNKLGFFAVTLIWLSLIRVDSAVARDVLKARLVFRKNALKVVKAVAEMSHAKSKTNPEIANSISSIQVESSPTQSSSFQGVQPQEFLQLNEVVAKNSIESQSQSQTKVQSQAKTETKTKGKKRLKEAAEWGPEIVEKELSQTLSAPSLALPSSSAPAPLQTSSSPIITAHLGSSTTEDSEQMVAESKINGCEVQHPQRCPENQTRQNKTLPQLPNECGQASPSNHISIEMLGPLLQVKFASCCGSHNRCYANFDSVKDDCDFEFFQCMLDHCKGWLCKAKSYGYYRAVSDGGCPAFEKAQQIHTCR